MAVAMRYLKMRISCMVHGHDWRETSGSSGAYHRCWRCYSEREAREAVSSATAR
jgi:hypothetical protein